MGGSTDDDIVKRGGSILHRKTGKKRSVPSAGSALIAAKYYTIP
jgi:hypothetical protein